MAAPARPSVPIPVFCTSGAKSDPTLAGRNFAATGWIAASGQTYGEIPPYQWVNWTSNQVGQWIEWLASPISVTYPVGGAVTYMQNGNFDNGINLLNGGILKTYEPGASGSNYVSIQAPPGLTSNSSYTLPVSLPQTPYGMVLTSSSTGKMEWTYSAIGDPNPPPSADGVFPGYIGEQILIANAIPAVPNFTTLVTSMDVTPGVWDLAGVVCIQDPAGTMGNVSLYISESPTVASGILATSYVYGHVISGTGTVIIPNYRVSINHKTTYYLLLYAAGNHPGDSIYGAISASRRA